MLDMMVVFVRELLNANGAGLLLGFMFAAAMLVGGVLALMDATRSQVAGWVLAAVIFVAFEEFLRFVLLNAIDNPPTFRPIALALTSGVIYTAGLLVGLIIVNRTRRNGKRERRQLLETLAEEDMIKFDSEAFSEFAAEIQEVQDLTNLKVG